MEYVALVYCFVEFELIVKCSTTRLLIIHIGLLTPLLEDYLETVLIPVIMNFGSIEICVVVECLKFILQCTGPVGMWLNISCVVWCCDNEVHSFMILFYGAEFQYL